MSIRACLHPTYNHVHKVARLTHLAGGLQLFADPAHKLVWGADDDHISPINNVTELRHGHDVFRQLNVWQVPL